MVVTLLLWSAFFFHYTSAAEIYTLSLHDALPIFGPRTHRVLRVETEAGPFQADVGFGGVTQLGLQDRKSTRLNSSHTVSSYAVFCLKKKTIAEGSREIALRAQGAAGQETGREHEQ